MKTRRLVLFFLAICAATVACNGCGKKEFDEPTRYRSQAGLEKLTAQAQMLEKNNRAFSGSKDSGAKAPEVKDLDGVIRPVLKKVFGDAKIISESHLPETKRDGEVVENHFVYFVKRIMAREDGSALHAAFRSASFTSSPRLGSKPTIWSGGAVMSLFKSTSQRSYSLVINIDTRKQEIVVESYRLGSKYDRLM